MPQCMNKYCWRFAVQLLRLYLDKELLKGRSNGNETITKKFKKRLPGTAPASGPRYPTQVKGDRKEALVLVHKQGVRKGNASALFSIADDLLLHSYKDLPNCRIRETKNWRREWQVSCRLSSYTTIFYILSEHLWRTSIFLKHHLLFVLKRFICLFDFLATTLGYLFGESGGSETVWRGVMMPRRIWHRCRSGPFFPKQIVFVLLHTTHYRLDGWPFLMNDYNQASYFRNSNGVSLWQPSFNTSTRNMNVMTLI